MEANISLYELNRSIIKQQGPLKEEDIKSKMDMLKEYLIEVIHSQSVQAKIVMFITQQITPVLLILL